MRSAGWWQTSLSLGLVFAWAAGCTPENDGNGGSDSQIRMLDPDSGRMIGSDMTVPIDTDTGPDGDGGGRLDAGADEGAGGQGGAGGMGGMGGTGGMGGDLPPECTPGDTRCPTEGQPVRQRCNFESRWAIEPCDEGQICLGTDCLPDPRGCTPGERICLPNGQPAACAGDDWVPDDLCPAGEACFNGGCLSEACAIAARRSSYEGCDYLAVDLPNSAFSAVDGTTPDAPWAVVVANPDLLDPARLTVHDPEGNIAILVAQARVNVPVGLGLPPGMYQAQTVQSEVRDATGMVIAPGIDRADGLEVPPGGQATLLLPRRMGPLDASSVRRDAYRLTTDRPVVTYQFSPYCCNYSFSNDASLLIPTTALGVDYRFLGAPQVSFVGDTSNAVIAIVAAEDNTDVDVRLVGGATVLPDRDGRVRAAGGHVANRLAAQEVMLVHSAPSPNIFTVTDLSGAQVTANKPISVFAVHVCTNYPQDQAACDHLQEQLLPVDTWGNSFQLVPPATRARNAPREVIYWKIIGTNADANITLSVPFNQLQPMAPGAAGVPDCRNFLNGQDTIRLRPDQFCEFGTKRAVQLVSDTPIMVAGFIVGQEATGLLDFGSHAGDPAMFIVPPDRQYRRSYGFLTPDTYFSDYVTVTYLPGNELLLDGQPIDLADGIQVPGSNYFYKHVPVDDGPHLIEGRSLFGIMVYAYDDFVSYAFTGGLNLTKQ